MLKVLATIVSGALLASSAGAVIATQNPAANGGFSVGSSGLPVGPGVRTYNTIAFNFLANQAVRLQFNLAGNPNGDGSEAIAAGFMFRSNASISLFEPGGALGNVLPDTNLSVASRFVTGSLPDSAGVATYVIDFVAAQAGSVFGRVQTGSVGGIGPAISNLQIGIYRSQAVLPPAPPPPNLPTGPLPEPGTWALLVAGFGLAGTTLRRRRRVATA